MDDHALRVRVETANLFCRVNPSQKDRVIFALKARGHVVGYLGDGLNDAPSLHSADAGLSVDSAALVVLKANEALFQTGWFVESLSTQVLVIFIIRTRGNPFKSRAHPILVATSLAVAVIGAVLPFTPLGTYFGFVPPPVQFYFILAGMVVVCLVMVEIAKQGFYRWHKISGKVR